MSTSVKITVEQYQEMTARGDFEPREQHRVELIRGEIVPKFSDDPRTPMNPPHAATIDYMTEWSFEVVPRAAARIRIQCSISITALDSVPDPDITWLARKDYSRELPTPGDVLLLIEVSDTTIAKDRGPKLELYAEAGIREYWIVDINRRRLLVHRDPHGTTYGSMTTFVPGQEARTLVFPDISLPVSRIFPD